MDLTPVVPAELSDVAIRRGSLEVKYDGVVRRLDLSDLAVLSSKRMGLTRTSTSYKDKPNYAGYYWAATTGRSSMRPELVRPRRLLRCSPPF